MSEHEPRQLNKAELMTGLEKLAQSDPSIKPLFEKVRDANQAEWNQNQESASEDAFFRGDDFGLDQKGVEAMIPQDVMSRLMGGV